MPSGFDTWAEPMSDIAPVSWPGVTANAIVVNTGAANVRTPTSRHRREGRCPSGYRRNSGMNAESIGTRIHRSTQAAASPNGSDPGSTVSARVL